MSTITISLSQEKLKQLEEIVGKIEGDTAHITVNVEKPKWEPESDRYIVTGVGDIYTVSPSQLPRYRAHGSVRASLEAAARLAEAQRIFNRLHAYVEEHAPGYEAPPYGEEAWYVYKDGEGRWSGGWTADTREPTVIYMPEDVARELARKLNTGEVEL